MNIPISPIPQQQLPRDLPRPIPTLIVGAENEAKSLIDNVRTEYPDLDLRGIVSDSVVAGDEQTHSGGGLTHSGGWGLPLLAPLSDVARCIQQHKIRLVLITLFDIDRKFFEILLDETPPGSVIFKIVPQSFSLLRTPLTYAKMRPLQAEDLIGRRIMSPDLSSLENMLKGKIVLVTGAGGSIGSELVRKLLTTPVQKIFALARSEFSLYTLRDSLEDLFPLADIEQRVVFAIGNAKDYSRLQEIAQSAPIDVILHAAAHKHVPIMEENEKEAIKNNVFVTLNLLRLAEEYQIRGFVFVSTDKAVTPQNVMGASKKFAEEIIHLSLSRFKFASTFRPAIIRLGNVISSRGSVVPLFNKQIKSGGPITVTHPQTQRYFMTVQEAALLMATISGAVLQDKNPLRPASLPPSSRAEVYILTMGLPISIDALVRRIIRLHGLIPEKDIAISYIGMLPGEKLNEVLYEETSKIKQTTHPAILEIHEEGNPLRGEKIWNALEQLEVNLPTTTRQDIRRLLKDLHLLHPTPAKEPT